MEEDHALSDWSEDAGIINGVDPNSSSMLEKVKLVKMLFIGQLPVWKRDMK